MDDSVDGLMAVNRRPKIPSVYGARVMGKKIKISGYAVCHGRTLFTDTIRKKKRSAINAYVSGCDPGWTWKRLYASGARARKISGHVTIKPGA